VAAGFTNSPLPDDLALLVQSGQQGMGLLAAMSRIQAGIYGEARALTEGLALLRALGQEQAARRTALELMILERRG
jgi:pilus assembly protein TadC